jgi:hypothetical protein
MAPLRQILAAALWISLLLYACVSLNGDELEQDHDALPSFYGPGTFLAWLVTRLDYSSEDYYQEMLRIVRPRKALPASSRVGARPYRLTRTVQRLSIYAYILVALIYALITFVLSEKEDKKRRETAVIETIFLLVKVEYALGDYLGICMVPSHVHFLRSLRSVFWRVLGIVMMLPLSILFMVFLHIIGLILQLIPLRSQDSVSDCLRLSDLVIATLLEVYFRKIDGQLAFNFRAPIPRTNHSVLELDQMFPLGLALACYVESRRATLAKLWKRVTTFWSIGGIPAWLQRRRSQSQSPAEHADWVS